MSEHPYDEDTIAALRQQAGAALDGAAAAVLVDADGRVLAANAAAQPGLGLKEGALLPAMLAAPFARILATLRPGRPPRLERLLLPGRLAPGTFACTLFADGRARAALLVALDGAAVPRRPVPPAIAPSATSQPLPPPPPEEAAPTEHLPPPDGEPRTTRFIWRTGPDGRLSFVDPVLAEALGQPAEALVGADWATLGAEAAHRAVIAGGSFARLVVEVATAQGGRQALELGAAPARPSGMRGFGLLLDAADAALEEVKVTQEPEGPPPQPPAPQAEPPEADPVAVPAAVAAAPASRNVVPLRPSDEASTRPPRGGLSPGERNAFHEIARALGARLEGATEPEPPEPAPISPPPVLPPPVPAPADGLTRVFADSVRPILDRLPLGIVVHRDDELLYANRTVLDWTGHASLAALRRAGGIDTLFAADDTAGGPSADEAHMVALHAETGEPVTVEARLMTTPWDGGQALLYVLRRANGPDERVRQAELALREAEATARELRAILDTATDGVVLIDVAGTILSMNHPAEALFGFGAGELQGESFTLLFAPESRRAAIDYLDGLAANGVASVLNDGREVVGRARQGGAIPLFMTVGRVGDDEGTFCAVLRDITQWKRAEEELTEAKQIAERASLAKSDFLAKISHEIRTPLNAIIGFSEVMMEERFGPIENQRYRDYLRDIHASGGHLISLINDLLDLSKIEAGKLDLAFSSVSLNEVAQQGMAIMQPQANRERIIIRSSLAEDLPPVVADARSIRQIVLNLVSNSIKFTRPGGQVILSTAFTDSGEVVLRVRDTGVGMSESDIATAMEPFRQLATSGRAGSGGTGLGLPLTKALAEANRASFLIRSAVDAGTLVEITFPSTRVLAE
ncbi:MAG TPA: PAS domain-containing sensor histidine kinase [Xanthobacteraceae bacterium]|nr:PAS domain-containing sensor histidine kinase [Xanthobacteraceae bacterium]